MTKSKIILRNQAELLQEEKERLRKLRIVQVHSTPLLLHVDFCTFNGHVHSMLFYLLLLLLKGARDIQAECGHSARRVPQREGERDPLVAPATRGLHTRSRL